MSWYLPLSMLLLVCDTISPVDGAVMCDTNAEWQEFENSSLTTFDYPAMISAMQCRCTLSMNSTNNGLSVDVLVLRKDDAANECQSHVLVEYQNVSSIICPAKDPQTAPTYFSFPLQTSTVGLVTLTLKNPKLDFMNAIIVIRTTDPTNALTISCTSLGSSLRWNEIQISDDMSGGVYVGVGVFIFVILVLLLTTIKRTSDVCGCTGKQSTEFNSFLCRASVSRHSDLTTFSFNDSEPTNSSAIPLLHNQDCVLTETKRGTYSGRISGVSREENCDSSRLLAADTPRIEYVTNWFKCDDSVQAQSTGQGSLWLMERALSKPCASGVLPKPCALPPQNKNKLDNRVVALDANTAQLVKARDEDSNVAIRGTIQTSSNVTKVSNGTRAPGNALPQGFSRSSVTAEAVSILAFKNSPLPSRRENRKETHSCRKPPESDPVFPLPGISGPLSASSSFSNPVVVRTVGQNSNSLTSGDLIYFSESKI